MDKAGKPIGSIDGYLLNLPQDIRKVLNTLRQLVRETVTEAQETISYQMPTFKLNGKNLLHFAAFKSHIGFYPTPSAIEAFQKDLQIYKTSKGAIQFPLGKPLPLPLIKRITLFRVNELKNK